MDLICKFVERNEERIGESIDVYNGYLIVKKLDKFFGIPIDVIEEIRCDVIIVSDFDEESGKEVGKKWIEEKSKPLSMDELKKYGFGEE